MKREYWTYLDESGNHYEISNLGRVRNARTQRIMHPTYDNRRKDYIFNINYKDVPFKKVSLKRAVLRHFGDLTRNKFVKIIDNKKLPSLENCSIYTWLDIERAKKEKVVKPQNKDVWNECYRIVDIICNQYYKGVCRTKGIDIFELIQEATLLCIEDYEIWNKQTEFYVYCKNEIKKAIQKLKMNDYRLEDYIIGKNYNEVEI